MTGGAREARATEEQEGLDEAEKPRNKRNKGKR